MTDRQKAGWALVGAVALWSLPSLFVKFLMPYYDPFSQNFLRYVCGTAVVVPLLHWQLRRRPDRAGSATGGLWDLTGRQWLRLLGPMVPNVLYQVSWVFAMQWVYPALTAFLNKSSIVFAAVLAYLLFPEERWLFRSRRFVYGLLLALLGTIGLALFRPDLGQMKINLAVVLVLFSATMWALYSVSVKRITAEIGATRSFAVICGYSTVVQVIPLLLWGDLRRWPTVPGHINVVLVVSGVLCIGLAHPLYYYAIQRIGVAVCSTMLLVTPLFVLWLSSLLFGEKLTVPQIGSGLLLLAGGALTLLAREKATPAELAKAAETAEA